MRLPQRGFTAFGLTLAFGSCTLGPEHTEPELPIQQQFATADDAFTSQRPDHTWWRTLAAPKLDELVADAVSQNLDLRAAVARIAQARAAAGVADAALLPRVDALGSYERVDTTESTPLPIRGIQYDAWTLGFDTTWEIDLFGRLQREQQAAAADLAATAADADGVRLALIAEVVTAYAELHGALLRDQFGRRSADAAEELLQLTHQRADGGLGTALDVTRAERLLAATRARLPVFARDYTRAALRLGVLTGREPAALLAELRDSPPPAAVPDLVALGLPAELVRRRPDVAAAERRLAAASARVGAALADRFPRISLSGFFGLEANRGDELLRGSSTAWRVGPSVRVPLFTGGGVTARIRQREAELEEARLAVQQQVLVAFEEVENAITALQQERLRQDQLATAVAAAEATTRLAQQRYEAGLDDFLGVLDAEQSRLDLADQQALATTELVRQFAALHKALGGGAESRPNSDDAGPTELATNG